MNAPTKVENSVKQYILTLKAGEKRTESVSAKKRILLRQFILNRKTKTSLIICNQKRSVTAIIKSLDKDFTDQVYALEGLSKEDIENKIQSAKNKSLFFVGTHAQLKDFDNKTNISHILQFDLPTKVKDYLDNLSFAISMKKPAEIWSFVSPEDTKYIQNILDKNVNLQLGRLKGHHNVNIGIDFHSDKLPTQAKPKKSGNQAEEKADDTGVKTVDEAEPDKKSRRKKSAKPSSKQKKQPKAAKAAAVVEEAAEDNVTTDVATDIEAVSKTRTRPRKTKPDTTEQRLPKKRTRRRQSDKITEVTAPEQPAIEEPADNEIKLDIEVKQMAKPKVRRNPQGRIIGMGEHTPAFMLKEILFKNSTLETEDE